MSETTTLAIGGAAGTYREVPPVAALENHFRCAWFNKLAIDHDKRLGVLPDGCVDIIWIDGEMTVAGPDVRVAVSEVTPTHPVVGVRFRPGASMTWLGLPMSEIVDGRIPLREFWGSLAGEIAQRIGDVDSTEGRMRALETALCARAPAIAAPPRDMAFVFNALETESAGPRMSVILDRLGTSPRTLLRRCRDAFGYGPKTLDRILRFQRFMKLARGHREPSLASLAFEAGYADQPHLTREVRRFTGLAPATLLSQIRI